MLKQCHKQYLTILAFNIFTYALIFLVPLDNSTLIVWPWEPELGVIQTSLPGSQPSPLYLHAYRVQVPNASVNTCNNNVLTKP